MTPLLLKEWTVPEEKSEWTKQPAFKVRVVKVDDKPIIELAFSKDAMGEWQWGGFYLNPSVDLHNMTSRLTRFILLQAGQ